MVSGAAVDHHGREGEGVFWIRVWRDEGGNRCRDRKEDEERRVEELLPVISTIIYSEYALFRNGSSEPRYGEVMIQDQMSQHMIITKASHWAKIYI